MKKVLIREYGEWIPVFCLPSIYGISRATVYRSLKVCGVKPRSLFRLMSVVMARDLYKLYRTKWFRRYIQGLRASGLIDYKPDRDEYVTFYAGLPTKKFKQIFHPPDELIKKGLLEVTSEQLTDLIDCGLVPTVQLNNITYCLPWWFDYVENKR